MVKINIAFAMNIFGFSFAHLMKIGEILKIVFVVFLIFSAHNSLFAQPSLNDSTFNTADVGFGNANLFNHNVSKIEVLPNGKILIAGAFTMYNGISVKRIIRLNQDGSLDTTFNKVPTINNSIHDFAVQPDGKIVIGGVFSPNSTITNRCARLNIDGSLDSTFNIGTGPQFWVASVAIQPDGKIILGGIFTTFNGSPYNGLIRLNSNGSIDTSFNIGSGVNGQPLSIVIQPNGKIIIAGSFSSYNGYVAHSVARINANGSFDTTFNASSSTNSHFYKVVLQADGKLLLCGNFYVGIGVGSSGIFRLTSNGTTDTSFNVGSGPTASVRSIY